MPMILVVGAGLSGSVLAERIASQLGKKVFVVDRRAHVAGNCYDENRHGQNVHIYGPHYFRTNSDEVMHYLSQFTSWMSCLYRVQAEAGGRLWSFPINLTTFEQYTGQPATTADFEAWLAKRREPVTGKPCNAEEQVLSVFGKEFYDLFFDGYTRKQWGMPANRLSASVTARIPLRLDRNDTYLTAKYQALPANGYTEMVQRILTHDKIEVRLNTDYDPADNKYFEHVIYTGPIDAYFRYTRGRLPYRSLEFEFNEHEREQARPFILPALQVNYPDASVVHTRKVDYTHLPTTHPGYTKHTVVTETSVDHDGKNEPYYPLPTEEAHTLFLEYRKMADAVESDVTFLGRMGTFRYLNMDQVIAMSLRKFEQLASRLR